MGDLGRPIPGLMGSQTLAVDYDPTDHVIYWSDYKSRVITRAYLNGTGQFVSNILYSMKALTNRECPYVNIKKNSSLHDYLFNVFKF
jgi:hypothetical protein